MTTISDIGAPAIDGELRQPQTGAARNPKIGVVVALLCGSAMLVTAMNLAAAAYLYRSSGEIRVIETRLDELAEFERRMKDRLDLVNTGIQSQFDHLNRGLEGRFGELNAGINRLAQDVDTIEIVAADQDPVGAVAIGLENAPSVSGPVVAEIQPEIGPSPVSDAPRSLSRKRPGKPTRAISPAYQRSETPDGKVYYRKVQ